MPDLTPDGLRALDDLARRHGFSSDAAMALLQAVSYGGGTQAQFNHPELGGMGQWSSGGMIMIGDMFNNALKARVANMAEDIAGLLRSGALPVASPANSAAMSSSYQSQSQGGGFGGGYGGGSSIFVGGGGGSNWWPGDLGSPGSTGGQNSMRYAYFPATRRLAIDVDGSVTVYDTGDHSIGGFSQQQSGDRSMTFTSQYGTVRVADLPVISGKGATAAVIPEPAVPAPVAAAPMTAPAPTPGPGPYAASPSGRNVSSDIMDAIGKLGDLHKNGVLTKEEFETKKVELLKRL